MGIEERVVDRGDRSAWAWSLALTAALVAATMLWSCVLAPDVHHLPSWWIPGDAWVPLPAAHYIAWGAFPAQYAAGRGFVYLAGLAILLTPSAVRRDHLLLWAPSRGT